MKKFSKEDLALVNIKKKNPIVQYFCKHKDTQWFGERTLWLGGQNNYEICKECGKSIKIYCERY